MFRLHAPPAVIPFELGYKVHYALRALARARERILVRHVRLGETLVLTERAPAAGPKLS